MKHLLLLALILQVVFGQELYSESCSDFGIEPMKDVDIEKAMGRWYEQERYDSIYQMGTECNVIDYTYLGDHKVKIINTAKFRNSNTNTTIEGTGTMLEPEEKVAKMRVVFPYKPLATYYLLTIDYARYTILWSCTDGFFGSFNMLWVLTRDQEMSDDIKKEVYDFLDKTKLKAKKLRKSTEDIKTCNETAQEPTDISENNL